MTKKELFFRFVGFVVIAVAAMPLFAVTVNALIYFEIIHSDRMEKDFGQELISSSVMVWCGALIPGFIGIFPKESWRYVIYLSPAYAPSLYAIAKALTQ